VSSPTFTLFILYLPSPGLFILSYTLSETSLRARHLFSRQEKFNEISGMTSLVLSVRRNFSRGIGVIPSLAERGGGGAVLAAYVSVGTTRLECSVLEGGQVDSTVCWVLVGTSHSDCITMMCNLNVEYGVVVTGFCRPPLQ
jgi:hypothetical protein